MMDTGSGCDGALGSSVAFQDIITVLREYSDTVAHRRGSSRQFDISLLPYPFHIIFPVFIELVMPQRLIVYASDAILPNSDQSQPAEIEVDLESGKILAVRTGANKPLLDHSSAFETFNVRKGLVLLPGLLE